ncbi:hypothetical protein Tco_0204340 [Tanacetum coccineum]
MTFRPTLRSGFGSLQKALEDNFSELRQTNQYAEPLSSIPGIVDHYLANKMQEAVDVAVQLKYDRIREESNTENQQFLDSIDEGIKKVINEQVKKEVSKITPKIEKLVIEQLESEVLVRSSKKANTSNVLSDIQRQLYRHELICVERQNSDGGLQEVGQEKNPAYTNAQGHDNQKEERLLKELEQVSMNESRLKRSNTLPDGFKATYMTTFS